MKKKTILITGGLGFIGTNLAIKLLKKGHEVIVIDNLSRGGNLNNLAFLKRIKTNSFVFIKFDLTQSFNQEIINIIEKCDLIYHLAAQVAVTSSITDPYNDFKQNVEVTLKLLEVIRKSKNKRAKFIFSSTNKVYGKLNKLKIFEKNTSYSYKKNYVGVNEQEPLDFYSPYGCSKGAADSYVLDYSRIYDIDAIVLRKSCIYGPFQYGIEDQGWLAWFSIAYFLNKKITIYGNGKQVRDILSVDDLTDLYCKFINSGRNNFRQAYNVGGGINNSISLIEYLDMLEKLYKADANLTFSSERQGDQKIYISDITKVTNTFNWKPKINVKKGLNIMNSWIGNNINLIKDSL